MKKFTVSILAFCLSVCLQTQISRAVQPVEFLALLQDCERSVLMNDESPLLAHAKRVETSVFEAGKIGVVETDIGYITAQLDDHNVDFIPAKICLLYSSNVLGTENEIPQDQFVSWAKARERLSLWASQQAASGAILLVNAPDALFFLSACDRGTHGITFSAVKNEPGTRDGVQPTLEERARGVLSFSVMQTEDDRCSKVARQYLKQGD